MSTQNSSYTSITTVLQHLANHTANVEEVVDAISLIFLNGLSPTQCASLLTFLQTTPFGQNAEVIAKCAARMRDAGSQVDCQLVQDVVNFRTLGNARGSYRGGMCTIEGTGGDGYSTFNVSTAAAILASAYVFIAKHGAGASSSSSGAADVLRAIGADSDGRHPRIAPVLESVTPESLPAFYKHGSFAFLFSPVFHPGVR